MPILEGEQKSNRLALTTSPPNGFTLIREAVFLSAVCKLAAQHMHRNSAHYGSTPTEGLMRQLYLISYDISSNARRARVLRAIKGNALGGQKSVYECWLDQSEFEDARYVIDSLIDTVNDRVFFTRLDPRASVHTLGVATPPGDGQMFYLG